MFSEKLKEDAHIIFLFFPRICALHVKISVISYRQSKCRDACSCSSLQKHNIFLFEDLISIYTTVNSYELLLLRMAHNDYLIYNRCVEDCAQHDNVLLIDLSSATTSLIIEQLWN